MQNGEEGEWLVLSFRYPPFDTWYSYRSRDGIAGVAETGSYSPNSLPFLFGHTVSLILPASFSVIYGPVVEFWATVCRWIDVYSRNI